MARLDQMPQAMRVAIGNLLARRNDRLQSANALLDALSPMATLRRGYTITRVNGKVVSSVQSLSPGDKITTSVHDGVMESVVANIKNIGNSK